MINLAKQFKGHVLAFAGIVLLLILAAWSDLSLPTYTSKIVDIGIARNGYAQGTIPPISQNELLRNSLVYIGKNGGWMLVIAFVGAMANITSTLLGSITSSLIAKELREKVYSKVMTFSHDEIEDFSTASLITRTTNDITQVQGFIQIFFRLVLYAPILSIGAIGKVLRMNRDMSWTILVGVIAVAVLISLTFSLVIPKFKVAQKLVDEVNRVLRENLTGLSVVRAFNNQKFEEQRFKGVNENLTKNNRYINNVMSLMMPMMMLIMNLLTVLIVFVGAHRISAGSLQVGEMMAFMTYAMQIMMSFIMISMVAVMLPRATVAMGRIQEVLDRKPLIIDPINPMEREKKAGYLEFRNVSYQFDDAPDPALCDVSFVAKPGETTAIIGSTGSGKSTIIHLILRFMDVSKGKIVLDGVGIRNMTLKQLRESIGVVPQRAVLFRGSIEENIHFGKRLEDMRLEDGIKQFDLAVEVSQSAEFMNELTQGKLAEVTQNGLNFSGGQKQRLAIGRALAKNAQILLFDDSFSALDYKTDKRVRRLIKEHYKDKNIIIVGQRISSIMDADQILVMNKGKLVGKGTHEELIQHCVVYQEIANSQLSEEEMHYGK